MTKKRAAPPPKRRTAIRFPKPQVLQSRAPRKPAATSAGEGRRIGSVVVGVGTRKQRVAAMAKAMDQIRNPKSAVPASVRDAYAELERKSRDPRLSYIERVRAMSAVFEFFDVLID
jgi:hypothetical protein